MLKLARFRRLDNRMSSGAELGKANLVAPMSTSFPNAIASFESNSERNSWPTIECANDY